MAETKNLDSELKRLLKLMNIIDIGLNQNTNWNIQRIIIALLLIISVTINYKMGYIEFFDNNVDISMGFILLVIYWNSFLINCYAVAFALLFRFNDIQILWNNVNDISNLFTKMKILPKMEMRYNFIINGLIYFYQLLVLLYILMTRYKDNQLDFNAYFHIIIIFAHNTLRFAYDMQYCVFISLIKNYYKGINNFLKQRISNKLNIKQMQHIGECHQILIQTSENLQNFMSPIILCQIINSFVIIVTYTYGLICLYVLETSWYAIATTWISLITGFTICVLILPPIHCKNEETQVKENLFTLSNYIQEPILQRKITILSEQISSCEFQFSVFGIIVLDLEQIFDILSGIASYLFILLGFRQALAETV